MERYLRFAGAASILALAVSMLTGLLAGVGFGTVILRAMGAALVFAGGAAGLVGVIDRMLPGLIAAPGDHRSASDEIGGESTARAASVPGGRLNIVVEDDGSESDDLDEDSSDFDQDTDLVEEVEEQGVDDEDEVMHSVLAEEADDSESDSSEESLDEVPDIGSFAGSFVSSEDEEEMSGVTNSASPNEHAGIDGSQAAKAIRTILDRDK